MLIDCEKKLCAVFTSCASLTKFQKTGCEMISSLVCCCFELADKAQHLRLTGSKIDYGFTKLIIPVRKTTKWTLL